jgi:putative hydrolase of the HAD superfamily
VQTLSYPSRSTIEAVPDIHAVLFDYGLVLSGPPDPHAWERMKSLLGADEAGFQIAYWRHRDAYDRGALVAAAYWAAVANDLHCSLDPLTLAALNEADVALWTRPNQDMIAWAAELQRAGYKTGILSNIGDAMEAGILARFDWLQAFHHHTFSHRLHIAKPDLAIYRHAAEGLGEDPSHILFVDDREDNILAAREAGMVAIQYQDHAEFTMAMRAAGLQNLFHSKEMS